MVTEDERSDMIKILVRVSHLLDQQLLVKFDAALQRLDRQLGSETINPGSIDPTRIGRQTRDSDMDDLLLRVVSTPNGRIAVHEITRLEQSGIRSDGLDASYAAGPRYVGIAHREREATFEEDLHVRHDGDVDRANERLARSRRRGRDGGDLLLGDSSDLDGFVGRCSRHGDVVTRGLGQVQGEMGGTNTEGGDLC